MFWELGYKPDCICCYDGPFLCGGRTERKARDPGVWPRLFGCRSGRRLPARGEFLLGSTDCCLRWLASFLPTGGLRCCETTSVMGCSGYYFILMSIFCLLFSALSHLVTSKEAFAFCSLSSCFTFSIISSLSFNRLRSLFRLEMDRLCGRWRIAEDLAVRWLSCGLPVFPLADRVADLDEWALCWRGRLLLLRLFIRSVCELELNALPRRSLGAIFAYVAVDKVWD